MPAGVEKADGLDDDLGMWASVVHDCRQAYDAAKFTAATPYCCMGIQDSSSALKLYSFGFSWAVETTTLENQVAVEGVDLFGSVGNYAFNSELYSGANGIVAGVAAIVAATIMMQ